MATYAAMRQTFIDLLNRSDCTDPNAALVKGWFDNSIQLIQREVRAPHMERVLTVDTTLSVSQVTIPGDWLETKAFVWDDGTTSSGEIAPLELGTFYHRKNEVMDRPTFYCREGTVWRVNAPIPAGTVAKVIYYGEETPLVNDNDETTLCQIASDLIVYGALLYAGTHFIDDRKTGWQTDWSFFREQVQSQSSEGDNQNGANAVQPFVEFDDGV